MTMIMLPNASAGWVFVMGLALIGIGLGMIFWPGGMFLGVGIFFTFLTLADIKDKT